MTVDEIFEELMSASPYPDSAPREAVLNYLADVMYEEDPLHEMGQLALELSHEAFKIHRRIIELRVNAGSHSRKSNKTNAQRVD